MPATAKLEKLGALYRKHRELGAILEDYHGWQVAVRFSSPDEEARSVRETVGLAELCWLGKIEIKGEAEGLRLPLSNTCTVWPLARGHWLVTFEPEDEKTAWEEARSLLSQAPCLRLTDVQSVTGTLLLAGPRSREVLQKLTSLDVSETALADRSSAMTGLAHVPAMILRRDFGGVPAYHLLVGREYSEFVWDAVMHAGHACKIAPFGRGALEVLRRNRPVHRSPMTNDQ